MQVADCYWFRSYRVNSATQEDVTGLEWFKIAEQGFDAGSNTWATDDLIKNKGVFDFTMPSCIEEGDYIMRADLTALHNARPNKANGAQIYVSRQLYCFNCTAYLHVSFP